MILFPTTRVCGEERKLNPSSFGNPQLIYTTQRRENMKVWLRILLILSIIFSASSFVWFLLGSTAYFQRGMDIIGTTYLWGGGIPVLLFAVLFIVILIKGWTPTSRVDYVGICLVVVLSTVLSVALFQSVSTHGWANEKIKSDSIKL